MRILLDKKTWAYYLRSKDALEWTAGRMARRIALAELARRQGRASIGRIR